MQRLSILGHHGAIEIIFVKLLLLRRSAVADKPRDAFLYKAMMVLIPP